MPFTFLPTDAIRTAGQALTRSADQVAAAGAAFIDAASPPSPNAVRAPDTVELSGHDRQRREQSDTPDLNRAAGSFLRAANQHRANIGALDMLLSTGDSPAADTQGPPRVLDIIG